MKNEDAAKILDIEGEIKPAIVKKAFLKACIRFHPDKNPAGEEMMKAVNEAFETLKNFTGTLEQGTEGYAEALNEIIIKVLDLHLVNVTIEICGAWLWVNGETRPHAAKLGKKSGGIGLSFAPKKKNWYFRPDDWKSRSRGGWSMDDIRDEHGSKNVRGFSRKAITS